MSHPIHLTGGWSGNSSCYLFSTTLDTKVPYTARIRPETKGMLGTGTGTKSGSGYGGADASKDRRAGATTTTTTATSSLGAPVAFLVEREQLSVGLMDLVLEWDLIGGSSELEGCYGMGFRKGGLEAKCFLAGRSQFEIDSVEVWAVQ